DAPLRTSATITAFQPRAVTLDYVGDFADGSPTVEGTIASPYDPIQLDHTYPAAGSFRMHVTVSDGHGHSAERFARVDVAAVGDRTPPIVTILDGPSGTVASASTSFAFKANEEGSTFACSLEGADFASCTSPLQL